MAEKDTNFLGMTSNDWGAISGGFGIASGVLSGISAWKTAKSNMQTLGAQKEMVNFNAGVQKQERKNFGEAERSGNLFAATLGGLRMTGTPADIETQSETYEFRDLGIIEKNRAATVASIDNAIRAQKKSGIMGAIGGFVSAGTSLAAMGV